MEIFIKYFSWKLLFKNMIQVGEIRSAKLEKRILSCQFFKQFLDIFILT